MLPPRARERVELGLAIVLRNAPLRSQEPLLLEPVQRRIKRPLLDAQKIGRDLLDASRYPEAMLRPRRDDFEDQHVQGALKKIGFRVSHVLLDSLQGLS